MLLGVGPSVRCINTYIYVPIEITQTLLAEVESSRTSVASRTHFKVLGLGLEGQVLGLGLEASSPQKLACSRLEDSTISWIVKILWSTWKIFWKTFFCGDRLKNFCEDLFSLESTCACVLGPRPWPRAFLSLASRGSVLGKAVLGLGLGFFCVLGLEPCVLDSTSDYWFSQLEHAFLITSIFKLPILIKTMVLLTLVFPIIW